MKRNGLAQLSGPEGSEKKALPEEKPEGPESEVPAQGSGKKESVIKRLREKQAEVDARCGRSAPQPARFLNTGNSISLTRLPFSMSSSLFVVIATCMFRQS